MDGVSQHDFSFTQVYPLCHNPCKSFHCLPILDNCNNSESGLKTQKVLWISLFLRDNKSMRFLKMKESKSEMVSPLCLGRENVGKYSR